VLRDRGLVSSMECSESLPYYVLPSTRRRSQQEGSFRFLDIGQCYTLNYQKVGGLNPYVESHEGAKS